MKTSTFFACGTPKTKKELDFLIHSFSEHDATFRSEYGLQKVFSKATNEYIGIIGSIRCNKYSEKHNVAEGIVFLKSKYIGTGLGFWLEKQLINDLERRGDIMVASVWEQNKMAIRLMKKNGLHFISNTTKSYNKNTIAIEVYMKLPINFVKSTDIAITFEKWLFVNKAAMAI